jgi:hypothetical protein
MKRAMTFGNQYPDIFVLFLLVARNVAWQIVRHGDDRLNPLGGLLAHHVLLPLI